MIRRYNLELMEDVACGLGRLDQSERNYVQVDGQ